jgi:hypothetical protein
LLRVTARTNGEVNVRCGKTQLLEEDIRHVDVVVLPGMNQGLRYIVASFQSAQDRRGLHEVWARSNDVEYFHEVLDGPVFMALPMARDILLQDSIELNLSAQHGDRRVSISNW